jgi:hypothetical protein
MENEITLNGKEYVLKEEVKVVPEFEMFDSKTEAKLIKQLKTMGFYENTICLDESRAYYNKIGTMDEANVSMIIAKNPKAKMIVRRFIPYDYDSGKLPFILPNLKYTPSPDKLERCKYSPEYLARANAFFNIISSSVIISMKEDYPITLEDDNFKFILAPRVETE